MTHDGLRVKCQGLEVWCPEMLVKIKGASELGRRRDLDRLEVRLRAFRGHRFRAWGCRV